MFATTLKTVLLKTVKVTGVKLAAPADRIGLGMRATSAYPTDNLSPEHLNVLDFPAPKPAWEQSLSHEQMQQQMPTDERTAPSASLAGSPSDPGFSAARFTLRLATLPQGWPRPTQTTATGRTATFCTAADPVRSHLPGNPQHSNRYGRDCQSPNRNGGQGIAIREVNPAAAAKK